MDNETYRQEFVTWKALLLKCGSNERTAELTATKYASAIAARGKRLDTDGRGVRG
jgi:hypothetical protein